MIARIYNNGATATHGCAIDILTFMLNIYFTTFNVRVSPLAVTVIK